MDKALKNFNHKETNDKIAMQSKAICKRSKENLEERIEKRRLNANKRERERTKMRNMIFEQLRAKFKQEATKQEVLQLSRYYLKFLHKVSRIPRAIVKMAIVYPGHTRGSQLVQSKIHDEVLISISFDLASQMNTQPEFFEKYSCYDLQMGFRVYLCKKQQKQQQQQQQ